MQHLSIHLSAVPDLPGLIRMRSGMPVNTVLQLGSVQHLQYLCRCKQLRGADLRLHLSLKAGIASEEHLLFLAFSVSS